MGNGLTGATLRTEVPEYSDSLFAFLDFALLHNFYKGVLGIKRPCFPSKLQPLFPGNFSDGTVGS